MYILEPLDLDVIVAIQFGIYTEIRTSSVSLFHIIFNGDHVQRLQPERQIRVDIESELVSNKLRLGRQTRPLH